MLYSSVNSADDEYVIVQRQIHAHLHVLFWICVCPRPVMEGCHLKAPCELSLLSV